MPIAPTDLEPLIRELAEHPALAPKALHFGSAELASFSVMGPNALVWRWAAPGQGERGISLAYYDLDGQIVSFGLVVKGSEVVEIEVMRGDGEQARSLPKLSDLWKMQRGLTYAPRPTPPSECPKWVESRRANHR